MTGTATTGALFAVKASARKDIANIINMMVMRCNSARLLQGKQGAYAV